MTTTNQSEPLGAEVEEYDYDVMESFDHYDWSELIPTVIVYSIVFVLGICGNVLIIFTIARYRRFKNVTNIFLASLSSADLLLVTICVPVNVAKLFSYTWTFGVFLCKFVHFMQNVSAICSVLTLTAMSIERYYAIVHPIRAQYLCTLSQARKVIVGIWIASFILASPTLWIQIQLPVGERVPAYWCVRDWERPLVWRIYELYMLVLILVLPLTIMAGAYASIAREIWRVTYLRSTMIGDPAGGECCCITADGPEITDEDPQTSRVLMTNARNAEGVMMAAEVTFITADEIPSISREVAFTLDRMEDEGLNKDQAADAAELAQHRVEMGRAGSMTTTTGRSSSVSTTCRRCCVKAISGNNAGRPITPSERVQADHRIARKVIKMLVAVVVLFTICWSPYLIDNVLMSFNHLPGARTGPLKHMRIAFHLLSYINSCCNPFVYGFMSRNFRRGFKAAVFSLRPAEGFLASCCRGGKRRPRPRKRSVHKFSQTSICNLRTAAQIHAQQHHEPGYIICGVAVGTAPAAINTNNNVSAMLADEHNNGPTR